MPCDALDPVTRARVEAHVSGDPQARANLDLIEQALAPLALDAGATEPPPDLVLNTLARVSEHRCMLPAAPAASQAPRCARSPGAGCAGPTGSSRRCC